MQTIRIILSAAKSLQQEKLELADLVENLNHSLESRNANILMLVWDGSETEKNDFKDKISDTDLCLTLYYDTFDESTQSELETAYQSLCEGKNPKKIYVYFKEGETVPEQLKTFRDSFPTKYGHFYCSFSNIDTLKADFLLQFMEYQSKNLGSNKMLEVSNGKVTIDGKEYVDLKNVPFAGNNEEYNLLLKSIKKTQKLLAITEEDDPDYADYAADLQDMKERLSKMESSLWDTALLITRLSTTKCSERLKRAMDLFTAGDNKGAQAVLNEEEIERDVEHNLHLIQLGNEGRKGLKINIEEYRLKIRTLENEMSDDWCIQVNNLYQRCLEIAQNNIADDEYAYLLSDYGDFLMNEQIYDEVEDIYTEALCVYRKLDKSDNGVYMNDIYWILKRLSDFYIRSNKYSTAEQLLNETWELIKNSEETIKKGEILYHLAYLHSNQLKHELAEDELKNAVMLLESVNNEKSRDKLSNCLYLMGLLHKNVGNLTVAEEEANKALETCLIDNKKVDDLFLSRIYELLGNILSLKGETPSAIEMYEKGEDIIRELLKTNPNAYRLNLVCALGNLSSKHYKLGNYELAIEELQEAHDNITLLFKKYPLQYSEFYARIVQQYASVLKSTKRYEHAAEIIQNSISAYDILKETDAERHLFELANAYNLQGCIYLESQKYEKAKQPLRLALKIRQELAQKYGEKYMDNVAQTLNNIALLNCYIYKFEESEKQYQELIELYQDLSTRYNQEHNCNIALAFLNLAYLYQKQKKFDKAIEFGTKSIDLFKSVIETNNTDKNEVLSLLAEALLNISVVYFKKDIFDKAIISIDESINIYSRLSLTNPKVYEILLSGAYNQLAWFKYKLHEPDKAEVIAMQSLEIAKKHELKENIRMSLDTLACIHRELGETEIAKKEFLECIDICKVMRDTNKQVYDGKLAHEYIELAKLVTKNNVSESKDLIIKAEELLDSLDDNHKNDFKDVFDELALIHNGLK